MSIRSGQGGTALNKYQGVLNLSDAGMSYTYYEDNVEKSVWTLSSTIVPDLDRFRLLNMPRSAEARNYSLADIKSLLINETLNQSGQWVTYIDESNWEGWSFVLFHKSTTYIVFVVISNRRIIFSKYEGSWADTVIWSN